MQFKLYNRVLFILMGFALTFTACFSDLDTVPLDPDLITAATVYDDPAAYRQVLAKLYAGLAVTGQQGPAAARQRAPVDRLHPAITGRRIRCRGRRQPTAFRHGKVLCGRQLKRADRVCRCETRGLSHRRWLVDGGCTNFGTKE